MSLCSGPEFQKPQTVTTFCPVASAVHSDIREFLKIIICQNKIDGPRIQHPYLEYEVDHCSHKTRRDYDNGRHSGQVGEYADEAQSFLYSGVRYLRVIMSC